MKEKKKSANWNIAATHWLTSGLAIPLLFTLTVVPLLGYIFVSLLGEENASLPTQIIVLLLWPFVVWLGVKYSASYVNKKYIIENSKEIAILSTVYLAVIRGVLMIYDISQASLKLNLFGLLVIIQSVIVVVVFYLASRKYIRQDITKQVLSN